MMFERMQVKYPTAGAPSYGELVERFEKKLGVIDFEEREREERNVFGKAWRNVVGTVEKLSNGEAEKNPSSDGERERATR